MALNNKKENMSNEIFQRAVFTNESQNVMISNKCYFLINSEEICMMKHLFLVIMEKVQLVFS